MVHEVTDGNFEDEVLRSAIPCVIEFTAGFCTPCKEMAPRLKALSKKLDGKVKFCTVDTDTQRGLRIKFAIAAWPFIVYVKDGMKTPLFDQAVSEEQLEERIRYMLDGGKAPSFPISTR